MDNDRNRMSDLDEKFAIVSNQRRLLNDGSAARLLRDKADDRYAPSNIKNKNTNNVDSSMITTNTTTTTTTTTMNDDPAASSFIQRVKNDALLNSLRRDQQSQQEKDENSASATVAADNDKDKVVDGRMSQQEDTSSMMLGSKAPGEGNNNNNEQQEQQQVEVDEEGLPVFSAFVVDEQAERERKEERYNELLQQQTDAYIRQHAIQATNVVPAEEVDNKKNKNNKTASQQRHRALVAAAAAAVIGAVLVSGALIVALVPDYDDDDDDDDSYGGGDQDRQSYQEFMQELMLELSSADDLFNETKPQYKAMHWLLHNDTWRLATGTSSSSSNNNNNRILMQERYIVALLYFSTSGPIAWNAQLNFLTNTSVCHWDDLHEQGLKKDGQIVDNTTDPTLLRSTQMVRCVGGNVEQISLDRNNLIGTIPNEIAGLRYLRTLTLNRNYLHGTLPSSIGSMPRLENLDLLYNDLTGTLPSSLQNLTRLEYFNVAVNWLTGTIPPGLFQHQPIQFMNLNENMLTGTIPDFGPPPGHAKNQDRWTYLGLNFNPLTGSIPTSMTSLVNLQYLFLYKNFGLTGPLPATENWKEMLQFNTRGNKLTGTIPTEFGTMDRVRLLDISNNNLVGTIPTELGNMFRVQNLVLAVNSLTGTIPTELAQLQNVQSLSFIINHLSGSVPSSLLQLPNLESLDLSLNSFTGTDIEEGICSNFAISNTLDSLWGDCGGPSPLLECSCCTTCCGADYASCQVNRNATCNNQANRMEYEGQDMGAICGCSEDFDFLSCVDSSCQFCDSNEEYCFIDNPITGGYGYSLSDLGNKVDFFVSVEFVKGFDEPMAVLFNQTADGCHAAINGQECDSCDNIMCRDDYRSYEFDCSNLGYPLITGCHLNEPTHPLVYLMPQLDSVLNTGGIERLDCLPL